MLNEGAELSGDTLVGLNKRRSAGGVCSAQQRLLMGFQTTAEGKSRARQAGVDAEQQIKGWLVVWALAAHGPSAAKEPL